MQQSCWFTIPEREREREREMEDGRGGAHVALVAFPFGTHGAPLLSLGRHLAGAAPDVSFTFFTTSSSLKNLIGSNQSCSDATQDNLCFQVVPDGLPKGFLFSPERPQEEIEHFVRTAPEELRRALAALPPAGLTCVIADAFLDFAHDIADELSVPLMTFWTSGASSLVTHMYTDILRDTIGVQPLTPENGNTSIDCIPGMGFLRLQDLQEGILFGKLDSVFSLLLHNMARALSRSQAVIINTFESLEPFSLEHLRTKLLPTDRCNLFAVGPLHLLAAPPPPPPVARVDDDRYGCIPFLDSHGRNSVVYVSFGTVADLRMRREELVSLAEGLETSGVPFLWSLKPQKHGDLPPGFVDRVKTRGLIVPWAPQPAVLRHPSTGAFFTHCGWNSVLEAISGGVPVICRPFFGDQRLNARLVDHVFGFGRTLLPGGTCSDQSVEDALAWVRRRVGECREMVAHYKGQAHEAVGSEGSSSAAMEALLSQITGVVGGGGAASHGQGRNG